MRLTAALIVAATLASGCGHLYLERTDERAEALQKALGGQLAVVRPPFVTPDAEGTRLWKRTREFYARRQSAPAWVERLAPSPQMNALLAAVGNADREGLDPATYNIGAVIAKRDLAATGFLTAKGFEPREAGSLDVWLTYLYLKFSSDVADGISDLAHADTTWKIEPERFDPLAYLERALAENRVAESLVALTPDHPHYRALRDALARYREEAAQGGWPLVPVAARVKPGERSAFVSAVAARLAASADYTGPVPDAHAPAIYGAELQDAVKRFQRRHGLDDDGVIARRVVAEMNVPIDARMRQIALNLERWRWLPRNLGDRYILVNIPAYQLDVWDHSQVPLSMRVVVGKKDSPTPVFEGRMTYVVFSPYWNVPPDIARDETLPALMMDARFLERTNMEVVDEKGTAVDPSSIDLNDPSRYRFRQRPGGANSLGLVKFMFPNEHNVYLHDTPADSLFARASRSFSHGCVRVEQPVALAEYLLRDQPEWSPERIQEAMHADEERTVKLREAIPVYLGYWSASVTKDGQVQFAADVYGIDARQEALVADRVGRLRKAALAAEKAMRQQPGSRAAGL